FLSHDVVVEISGNRGHRNVAHRDLKILRVWELRRQNRKLDASGYVQFFLNLTELLVTLQRSSCGDVAETAQEDREPERLDFRQTEIEPGNVVPQRTEGEGQESKADYTEVFVV